MTLRWTAKCVILGALVAACADRPANTPAAPAAKGKPVQVVPAATAESPVPPKEATPEAKAVPQTAAQPTAPTVPEPFWLCYRLHRLEWRVSLMDMQTYWDAKAFVATLDDLEKQSQKNPSARVAFAIEATRQLNIWIGSQLDHDANADVRGWVDRLLFYHRLLVTAAPQSVEGSFVSDMSAYYLAYDTERLSGDPIAARPLWEKVMSREPRGWIDRRRYRGGRGPRTNEDYQAAARLALARNLALWAPTDEARAEGLLEEVEAMDKKGAPWSSYHQAARCYRAEMAAMQGDIKRAAQLHGELEKHVTIEPYRKNVAQRRRELSEQ